MHSSGPAPGQPPPAHSGAPPGQPPIAYLREPGGQPPIAYPGAAPAGRRSNTTMLAIAATVLLVLLIGGAVAVAVASGGNGSPTTTSTPTAGLAISPISSGQTSNSQSGQTSTASPTQHLSSPGTAPAPAPAGPQGTVTGRDPQGFNVGASCSDNPSSSLPGCNDSPSTPNGDPEGSCPNGITVDRQTTSCALAQNVQASYGSDGLVTAFSPERGQNYTFSCETGGPGTTGYTICQGQAGGATLYLRWHK